MGAEKRGWKCSSHAARSTLEAVALSCIATTQAQCRHWHSGVAHPTPPPTHSHHVPTHLAHLVGVHNGVQPANGLDLRGLWHSGERPGADVSSSGQGNRCRRRRGGCRRGGSCGCGEGIATAVHDSRCGRGLRADGGGEATLGCVLQTCADKNMEMEQQVTTQKCTSMTSW